MNRREMGLTKDRFERLNVRSMWEDEALDLTPWLAHNLNFVGDLIGKKLELKKQEKKVGSFLFLDILAKDTDSGNLVAIENQLNWSDTDHMGRLIAYATILDARIAIWVAPEFTHEHAEVLRRLNEWTKKDIEFYGIKVEVIRKSPDSEPEPRFLKVVYPGGWDLGNILPVDPPAPPHIQKYTDFFEPLINKLRDTGFASERPIRMFDHTGRYFPSTEHDGIWYAASLEGKNDAWVTVHIRNDDNEVTKHLFDQLEADKNRIVSRIEANFEPEWCWRRHDRHTFSSISIRKDGSIDDPADRLEETRAWMLDLLPRLKKVFDPWIAELLSHLQKHRR